MAVKILFVCVHNSGRSQMAEAFFNSMARNGEIAISAGTQPAEQINPAVVKVMHEVNLDISNQKPKLLTLEMLEDADRVITMGCNVEEVCPASFVHTEDWELADPSGRSVEDVRQIRDEVNEKVEELVKNAVRVERPLLINILLKKIKNIFRRFTH
jgi:protein-tyrosine-phosphatase